MGGIPTGGKIQQVPAGTRLAPQGRAGTAWYRLVPTGTSWYPGLNLPISIIKDFPTGGIFQPQDRAGTTWYRQVLAGTRLARKVEQVPPGTDWPPQVPAGTQGSIYQVPSYSSPVISRRH